MLLTTSVSAYLIPDSAYQLNWKTPKFLGLPEFLYIIYAVMAFSAGGILVAMISRRARYLDADTLFQRLYLPWNAVKFLFYTTFVIILIAYAVWLLLLLHSGLSLGSLAAALKGESGASFDIRDQGETLPA